MRVNERDEQPDETVRPYCRFRALRFAMYPRSRTIRAMRSRVSGATWSRELSTRETVAADTPASAAMS